MEEKKLLLFIKRKSLGLLLLFTCLISLSYGAELSAPVPSASMKEEARALKENAAIAKQRFIAEAIKRSHETKDVVEKVMKESTQGEQPPCLSSLGSTAVTPVGGGKCSVSPIDAHPKRKSLHAKTANLGATSDERILVFVSFSMPEASIKHLLESLKEHPEVTLVLRGLINDSMEKTARYIANIKGVFEINPERFEEYNIQVVPTFVLLKKDVPYAKLQGNITLTHAKELFTSKVPSHA